ncbi:hypothetical protein PAECIP111802_04399 [Paenibacillus allorhizosphaerae]|uniref:Spore protein YkvP/CgeB glycosyl transferase-like domain-containing protein n=1 Tax=Paenibacillus allorhizosphaerae TaxID=2849866 RepID=A0ABM8VM83_9BACL|nr:glycosyltransferase family 4 protein [Paenibacillus allorhizosphaerae]CAG7649083.1 hypothetical protein PAECIP111802_04399 [Paenibacillus allorhizosphaerae]
MRVVHLPYGIGISTLSRALRAQGVEAVSCSLRTHHYAYMADMSMHFDEYPEDKRNELRKAFLHELMDKYDIFHFHFGETFFPDKSDLQLLQNKGKKMIVHHRGSEARMLSIAKGFNNPYARVKRSWPEQKIVANLKLLSAYIHHAIVPDHELLPYVKPYYKQVHVVPYAINCSELIPCYPPPDAEPLVVHAPSHKEIKGTAYVLSAVGRLKKNGFPFRFKLIEKLPHTEALRLYSQAAIVIDQLRIGSFANLSLEAMAMGKPVICYIREDLRRKFPPELPIVSANPDTVYNVLKDLLSHPERWEKLGLQGRQYVEQFHGMEKIAKALIEIYHRL